MRVLVIGNRGNMGSRYAHVVRWLGHAVVGWDIGDKVPKHYEVDCAIIATPTYKHIDPAMWSIQHGIPFLCEKPVSRDVREVERLAEYAQGLGVPGYMVCNWRYVFPGRILLARENSVEYDCWRTGDDGLWYDCIQLVHLAQDKKRLSLKTDCPTFRAAINGEQVTLDMVQASYVEMVRCFVEEHMRHRLWTLTDALDASRKVEEWKE